MKNVPGGRGVNERAAMLLGALVGAILGGACGYLFLTERGRRLREELEPRLADLAGELHRARDTAKRARAAVEETFPSARPFGSA